MFYIFLKKQNFGGLYVFGYMYFKYFNRNKNEEKWFVLHAHLYVFIYLCKSNIDFNKITNGIICELKFI